MEQSERRAAGIYIASELPSIPVNSGARQHIEIGLRELGRQFSMTLFPSDSTDHSESRAVQADSSQSVLQRLQRRAKRLSHMLPGWLSGTAKDFVTVLKGIAETGRYVRAIRRHGAMFVYERSAYGHFAGLLAARLMRIPHFYEINGLHAEERRNANHSLVLGAIGQLQKWAYRSSNASFCIGGMHVELGIRGESIHTTQNGIEHKLLEDFAQREPRPSLPLKLIFLGHIMQHHRLDILFDAVQQLGPDAQLEITIAGRENPNVSLAIPTNVPVHFTGPFRHEDLPSILSRHDVGIIPFALDFYSNMKTFAYAAAKLTVVLPRTRNFAQIFDSDSALFFENEDPDDLARVLEQIQDAPEVLGKCGQNAYETVARDHTWEQIFARKVQVIMPLINQRDTNRTNHQSNLKRAVSVN